MNSIVLVNFNSGMKIKTLVSKYQSFGGVGVIVVDNGSKDSSVKGVQGVIENGKNLGFAAGANVGIRAALKMGAEKILLVNFDVELSQKDLKALFSDGGDIISPVLKFKRDGKWVYDYGGKVFWPLGRTYHYEGRVGPIDYVSGACVLVRRELFEKIGLFDERYFMYFEDVDFCLRAKAAGFGVQVDRNVVVTHDISEHRRTNDLMKSNYLLRSNKTFIEKWVPWYFWPTSYLYLLIMAINVRLKQGHG